MRQRIIRHHHNRQPQQLQRSQSETLPPEEEEEEVPPPPPPDPSKLLLYFTGATTAESPTNNTPRGAPLPPPAMPPYSSSAYRRRRRNSTVIPSVFALRVLFAHPHRLLLAGLFLIALHFALRQFNSATSGLDSQRTLTRFLCDLGGGALFVRRLLKCHQFNANNFRYAVEPLVHHHSLVVEPPWYEIWDESVEIEDAVIVRPPLDNAEAESCSNEVRQWRQREALAALHAAKRSRNEGNLRRARSIIEHAYSLAPYNADILTEYGVYMEMASSDVVQAEGFYLKALVRDPKHEEALIRRQKALPLVEEIDNRMMREIHRKRDRFMHIPRNDSGLKRSMRESYFAHVYHTVAMEGNTINLAQTRSILESRMAVAGKSIIEHNEILGLDAALRYLNQSLTEVREITLEDILALHKRVLGYADPLAAGVIRTVQVFVGSFRPPEPELVLAEMGELVAWLNDDETQGLDAVEVAALTHYKLVFIHPFMDGNGRTARLLMNWILLQAGFPPVIIPVEQRHRYYHVLKEANEGDLRPFIRFIAELTDRTLESMIASSSSSLCEIGGECAGGRSVEEGLDATPKNLQPQPFCTMESNEGEIP